MEPVSFIKTGYFLSFYWETEIIFVQLLGSIPLKIHWNPAVQQMVFFVSLTEEIPSSGFFLNNFVL